jgi:hypothetical protein
MRGTGVVTDHPASRTSERPQPFSRTMRPSSPTTGTIRERSRLGSGTKTGSTWCAIPKWAEPLPKFLAGLTTRHQHICKTWRYRAGCGTGARGDRLHGWACKTRTAKSVRELPYWNCVTTSLEDGARRRRRPFARKLHHTDLQLRPRSGVSRPTSARKQAASSPLKEGNRTRIRRVRVVRRAVAPTPWRG